MKMRGLQQFEVACPVWTDKASPWAAAPNPAKLSQLDRIWISTLNPLPSPRGGGGNLDRPKGRHTHSKINAAGITFHPQILLKRPIIYVIGMVFDLLNWQVFCKTLEPLTNGDLRDLADRHAVD